MDKKVVLLLVLLVLLTWAGSAAIAIGVAQTVEGPRGEQGPPGPQGPSGPAGESVEVPAPVPDVTNEELQVSVSRLTNLYAMTALLTSGFVFEGDSLSSGHFQVQACVDYIMNGKGSAYECGFTRAGQRPEEG